MAKKKKQKKKNTPSKQPVVSRPKEFLDLIAPAAVKFNTDHFILGGTYRSVVALRSYPPTTEELALLRRLGEMAGVTLRLSARRVTTAEEDAIIHAATNKNRMERSNFSNIKQSVTAEEKIQDVETLIKTTRRQTEPLIHCSCFLELTAPTMEELRSLRDEVNAILIRSKLGTDPLLLRQRDGFLSSNPAGQNAFGSFAERVLPASSVANLYPISYSGKTDPMGFYVGRDKYGSNVIVDLDRRADDKTNASALILGKAVKEKHICSGSYCAMSWRQVNVPSLWTRSMKWRISAEIWEVAFWTSWMADIASIYWSRAGGMMVVSLMIQTRLLPSTVLSWPSTSHSFVTSSVSIRTSMSPTLTLWS